jgi:hypothetical protein
MTKPAGVFLQLLSIPVMVTGCMQGIGPDGDGGNPFGWAVFGVGVLMLYAGGKPARRKD